MKGLPLFLLLVVEGDARGGKGKPKRDSGRCRSVVPARRSGAVATPVARIGFRGLEATKQVLSSMHDIALNYKSSLASPRNPFVES